MQLSNIYYGQLRVAKKAAVGSPPTFRQKSSEVGVPTIREAYSSGLGMTLNCLQFTLFEISI